MTSREFALGIGEGRKPSAARTHVELRPGGALSFAIPWTGWAATWTICGELVRGMTARGVHVRLVKEILNLHRGRFPMANLLLSVMGAFAQFERELIRERQREGIKLSKKAGVYRGRKHSLTMKRAAELRRRVGNEETNLFWRGTSGVDRTTAYRYATLKRKGGA